MRSPIFRRELLRGAVAVLLLAGGARAGEFDRRFAEMRDTATPRQLYALMWDVPKGGDIHNHFTLTYSPEMWYRAATDPARTHGNEFYARTRILNCPDSTEPLLLYRNIQRATWRKLSACRQREYEPLGSLSAPVKAEWLSSLKIDRPGEGRNEFFEAIVPRVGEMFRDPWLLTSLMVENLKLNGSQGLRYIETQAGAAMFQDHEGKPLDPDRGADMLREALESPAARATGVTLRFQGVIIRFQPDAEQQFERVFAFVDRHRDYWVGVNMAGREDNDKGHPLRFMETLRKLRRTYSGIPLSLHGGEVDSPGQDVRRTLMLGARRIGHGVNLITDPETMLLMQGRQYLVEVNLISNQLLEYVPDIDQHPFPEYLRRGIPVCLNTDDPGAWDSNITDEYFTAVRHFKLTWNEIVEIGRNSLEFSFAQPEVKARLLKSYDAAVQQFERKYGAGDWRVKLAEVRAVPSGYAKRRLGIE